MKSFLYTIIASAYLLLTSGFALSLHYCHGELTEVGFTEASCCCAPSHGESDSGCCTDQELILLADLEEQALTSPTQIIPVFSGIEHAIVHLTEPLIIASNTTHDWVYADNSPPPKIYLQHFPLVLYS